MANVITTTPTGGLLKQRHDVAALMDAALAPFIHSDQWCRPIWAARDAASFVAVDKDGDLVALGDHVDWGTSRDRALEIQNKLPPIAEIAAAYKAVDQTLKIKPTSAEYQLFTSKMLDVLGIKGDDAADAYAETLAWTLSDAWPAAWEGPDMPGWIPIPAFAKAIQRVWEDRESWDHFGGTRRPPIPDIIEHCQDNRRSLVSVRNSIDMLGRTRQRLSRIIQAVNEYETEEW